MDNRRSVAQLTRYRKQCRIKRGSLECPRSWKVYFPNENQKSKVVRWGQKAGFRDFSMCGMTVNELTAALHIVLLPGFLMIPFLLRITHINSFMTVQHSYIKTATLYCKLPHYYRSPIRCNYNLSHN